MKSLNQIANKSIVYIYILNSLKFFTSKIQEDKMLRKIMVRNIISKGTMMKNIPYMATKYLMRMNSGEAKTEVSRIAKRKTLKEATIDPQEATADKIGQGALAGAAALGLGSLVLYGLGMSDNEGLVDKAEMWPNYVRERVRETYIYHGCSLVATAGAASLAYRSKTLMNLATKGGFLAFGLSLATVIGSLTILHSIPYTPGIGSKQLALLVHSVIQGIILAPFCILGGPILAKAAWYTFGMVGGLSTVAVCAPSDKFLYMGGPLAMGLGIVLCARIGNIFLPSTTAVGASMYSVAMYGGLILFGGFLLYDTQKIVKMAETHPQGSVPVFDPINSSIGLYLHIVNIAIRLAQLLPEAGG